MAKKILTRDVFDELSYLASYPDVRRAVADRMIPSGWAHFVQYGRFEGRRDTPDHQNTYDFATGAGIDEVLVAEKARLEIAMRSAPRDLDLRTEYFDLLELISLSHFGPFFANLPEIRTPLMFRGGSSDFWNMRQVFIEHQLGEQPYEYGDYRYPIPVPQRIFDLGAYVGYTAVYFANRFPAALIVAVEPSAANFRVLQCNTTAYPNIRGINAAVWHETTTVNTAQHLFGDWGTQYAVADAPSSTPTAAYTITDLLRMQGWDSVDFIKCILEGEQVAVLSAPDRPWLSQVSCVATKRSPAGRFPHPDDENRLLAAFPDDRFTVGYHGEMIFFTRRGVALNGGHGGSKILRLVPPPPALQRFALRNAPGGFEFHSFGDTGFSLTGNPPGQPPIAIAFPLHLAGQTRFQSGVASDTGPLKLRFSIAGAVDGAVLRAADHEIAGGAPATWEVGFPAGGGPHVVTLSVLSDAAGGRGRARFIDPRLL